MRISIDIDDNQVGRLDVLARTDKQSRSTLIRAAIDDYLKRRSFENAFGLWSRSPIDGLTHQKNMRDEW